MFLRFVSNDFDEIRNVGWVFSRLLMTFANLDDFRVTKKHDYWKCSAGSMIIRTSDPLFSRSMKRWPHPGRYVGFGPRLGNIFRESGRWFEFSKPMPFRSG